MTPVPRLSHDLTAPSWWPTRSARKQTAALKCGNGHVTVLAGHDIDDAGYVYDVVRCAYPECDWGDSVRLLGWVVT